MCENYEGACEVVQLANTYFQGLVSEFVEYVGGGEGVSGRGKPEEVRESTKALGFCVEHKNGTV